MPTNPIHHGMSITCTLIIRVYLHTFPEAISLKLYFLKMRPQPAQTLENLFSNQSTKANEIFKVDFKNEITKNKERYVTLFQMKFPILFT